MAIKYILDPSGKILKKDVSDTVSEKDAYEVSKDYLSRQKNYKESIAFFDPNVKLGYNALPIGGLTNIAGGITGVDFLDTGVNVTDEQKAIFEVTKDSSGEDKVSNFPKNVFGSLVNSSFGFDNDSPLKNYTSFDSFNGNFLTSSVF